jgi:hypothetical protein
MRFLLNTAPRGNCPVRRALPERAGKYSQMKTPVSVMLFPRLRRPCGPARPSAGSFAVKTGFAAVIADLKSQPFSESKRRE